MYTVLEMTVRGLTQPRTVSVDTARMIAVGIDNVCSIMYSINEESAAKKRVESAESRIEVRPTVRSRDLLFVSNTAI